jgi:hypothetical protein
MAFVKEAETRMLVERLDRECIKDNGWEEYTLSEPDPSWPQIQQAIRALDRYSFVSVLLHLRAGRGTLDVWGGRGKFALECQMPGELDRMYCDESKANGKERVRIWESNQGAFLEEKYLCDDIELVFRIARYFAERGRPYPRVYWEE